MDYLVIGVLGVFTLLSILNQFNVIAKYLARIDKLKLWPFYSFFAPNPFVNDFRVVYRNTNEEDAPWNEVRICGRSLHSRFLFHSEKYYIKGVFDSCVLLGKEFNVLERENRAYIQLSRHYINFVKLIADQLKRSEEVVTESIRFAIVSSENKDELKVNKVHFLSLPHKL